MIPRKHNSQCAVRRSRAAAGVAMVYIVAILLAIVGIASFAVDYGHVQLAKTELRNATDAAARYAVTWVSGGQSKVYAKASVAASENTINGVPLALNSADVTVGSWNASTRVFTVNAVPRNAVRIVSSASIPLIFGRVVGMSASTVRAEAIAVCVPLGIVGINGVSFKNMAFVASYQSSVRTNPTHGVCNNNAALSSNGYIGDKNNGELHGDMYIGPGGSYADGWIITGGICNLTSPIPTPADPAWNPTGNPGGTPAAFTNGVNNNVLPAGTYWFTSFSAPKPMSFAGPAVLYVNGNIDIAAIVTPADSIPANLKIYQLGAARTFNAAGSLIAQISAPHSDFVTTNNFNFYGSCIFNTITVKNSCDFYFDEDICQYTSLSIVK